MERSGDSRGNVSPPALDAKWAGDRLPDEYTSCVRRPWCEEDPGCTTELGYLAGLKPEFEKRNCKIIGLSTDSVSDHTNWAKDIEETQGHALNYPLIGDDDLAVSKLYDMIHPEATGSKTRTAADNATIRSVFVVGPDKKIKLMLTHSPNDGRQYYFS